MNLNLYDFVLGLLVGVDLEKYDFLPALIVSAIIILCLGATFKALLTIFIKFFDWRF